MALRLIIGRAGAGKTHLCLEELRAAAQAAPEGPPLILLVPEQATFQMEQALLAGGQLRGIMRAQVLSFQRLAWRVSLKAGGLALPPLSDLGKQMVLRALLERRRSDLRLFGQVADRPGFIERLAGTISEMRTYQQRPTDIHRHLEQMAAAGEGETALGAKLHDLSLVMQELGAYTAGRFTDPDEYLSVLAERLPESGLLDGAEVWVDGFTGFTPQELSVLAALFRSARQVNLTLCIAPGELYKAHRHHDPSELFHPTLTTYDQVQSLAAEQGVVLDEPVLLRELPRFQRAPALAHLEANLFKPTPPPMTGTPAALRVVGAQNRREEVEAAAREVLRLVRDEGLRYREIALVARNLDAYGDLAATVFSEYGIPAFVDRRRTVAHHPLVELLRSALEVVIQDWSYGPVFRYLKTDLTPVLRDEVDLLENYVIEHGIRGRSWQDPNPWRFVRQFTLEEEQEASPRQQALLDRVHRIRSRATAELLTFQRRLGLGRGRRPFTVRTITTALFNLLDDLKVATQLENWSAEAEARGDLEAAREHQQVWEDVLAVLDQMVEALGDGELELPEYLAILSAGLGGLRLGLIPPGIDQVVVGSVERSRHSGVRAALILGATEKDFPPQPAEDAIFTDRERERLESGGMEIGPTSLQQLFQEQYFTYVALTRSSDYLYLSYPLADESGRAVAPSPVVRRLQQLFPDLQPQPAVDLQPSAQLDGVSTPAQLAATMARAFRAHRSGYPLGPQWLDLYQWTAHDPALHAQAAPIMAAVAYEEGYRRRSAPLGPELARLLYGEQLFSSVSRLEAFMACPFKHFVGYGLRLAERARFQITAPELGLFYHAALSLFVRQLQEEGRSWEDVAPAEAAERLDHLVELLAPRLQSEILLSSPQHRYLLKVMRRTLQASLGFLNEHIYQGQFRPLWVELPFGDVAAGLPPVEWALPGGGAVRLRGRIDRVDGLHGPDGAWYLRVIDYKSSPRPLDLGRFYYGLSLQLLLYLYVVVQNGGGLLPADRRPAGALYFPVYDPVESLPAPAEPERLTELRRKRFKATGILLDEPEVVRAMDAASLGLTQVKLNKDGSVRKNAPVASQGQFQLLFEHMEAVVERCGVRLLSGEVGVDPFRMGGQAPCTYCPYRSVCQFDPTVEGQGYRSLERLKPAQVWERIGATPSEGGESDE